MKNICRLIISFFFVLCSSCRQETNSIKETDSVLPDSNVTHKPTSATQIKNLDSIATYKFVYPYNTEDLIENHYIKLSFGREPLAGKYYGTTDEFDEAREGYLPGFFVADLYNLKIQGDSIEFVILCSDDDLFTRAIDLKIQNSDEARKQGYAKWNVKLRTNMKKYKGSIQGDTIRIKNEIDDRVYLRVE